MGKKKERNHPHEGARQCCSSSPSGVLWRSSNFQFQLRSCRSTQRAAAGEASNHTPPSSITSHTFPLPCPGLDGVCTRTANWPWKNRITRSNCHWPPSSWRTFWWDLSHFLSTFHIFPYSKDNLAASKLTSQCTEWLLMISYVLAAFQTTILSHLDPPMSTYLLMHFYCCLTQDLCVSCSLSTSPLFPKHPHCFQAHCLLTL